MERVTGTVQLAAAGTEARMATRITVALQDGLGGGPADETIRLAIEGTRYGTA